MKESEARKGEKERLAALKCFDVLDTPAEEAFDRIARLAHTVLRMPIVKGLIDLHGGTFTLKSKPREGTEVIVTFPSERVMEALGPVGAEGAASSMPRHGKAA